MVVGADHHAAEAVAERQQPLALVFGQRARVLLLAQRELGLGLGELLQRGLPIALQSARDESMLGLDLPVAAFGPFCLI